MILFIDWGGTSFRYRFDNEKIIYKTLTKGLDIKDFLKTIVSKNKKLKNINISFAGNVNNGNIISSPNIDIENFNIKKYCKENFNIELKIDNDLNCAALAEHNLLEVPYLGVFYIGTGFGSAFINQNILLKGSNNLSAEIGHIPFKKTPFKCGCGRDNCLELSVSGSGIEKWSKLYKIDKDLRRLDKLEALATKESKLIVDNFYEGLSYAFHTALNLFDFNNLVLGGSVAKNEKIKNFLEKEFLASAFNKKELNISISNLKEGSLEGTKYL